MALVQNTASSGDLYVDGVLVGTSTAAVSSPDAFALVVGAYSTTGGYAFSGEVDEVRFSNGARYSGNYTPATGPFTSDSQTVALYHLDSSGADSAGAASVALSIGSLTAVGSASGVTLALSAPLSAGSGTGYNYSICRGTDPNFTVGAGSLLATVSTLGATPYLDTAAAAGVIYAYGVVGTDSAGGTVSAAPNGLTINAGQTAFVAAARSALPDQTSSSSATASRAVTGPPTVTRTTPPLFRSPPWP